MAKTGRKPYETSDVVAYMGSESRRLRPPTHLGPRERAVFLDLVTSVDPRQFRNSDIALLFAAIETVAAAALRRCRWSFAVSLRGQYPCGGEFAQAHDGARHQPLCAGPGGGDCSGDEEGCGGLKRKRPRIAPIAEYLARQRVSVHCIAR
jgi:hypothetical protein